MKTINLEPKKHHYIPVFYLKKWANNGKIFVFSRSYNGKLDVQEKGPKGSGFEENLYSNVNILSGVQENVVETEFFKQLDDKGARVLGKILKSDISSLEDIERQHWAKFIYYFWIRTPLMKQKNIEKIPEIIQTNVPEDDKSKFPNKWIERANESLPSIIYPLSESTKEVKESLEIISNLNWFVDDFGAIVDSKYNLLTSDQPILLLKVVKDLEVNTLKELLKHETNTIVFPISPSKCFMATSAKNPIIWDYLKPKERLEHINKMIACNANNYVYASNRNQEQFIEKYLLQPK